MEDEAKKDNQSLYTYLQGQYGKEEVEELFESEEDLNEDDLFEMLKDYEGINEIYEKAVQHKLQTDDTILPGDLVYSFPTWYPTRTYYGISIVSLNKEGKKILKGYGDGLSSDPITDQLLKQLIKINTNYFDDADTKLWSYLGIDGQGTTQNAVNSIVSTTNGGSRRRKTRSRQNRTQRKKKTRKH
jgi:hypothetical protein